ARGYYPGRSGQLFVVPNEGEFVAGGRGSDIYYFMHGSPWGYDTRIPLLFFWPGPLSRNSFPDPARQHDIAPTLATRLGLPPRGDTVTGRALGVWQPPSPPRRIVLTIVLDGGRADYLPQMPNLWKLASDSAAYFPNAQIDYLPTCTAVGHATIATGGDPRIHGIVGNSMYDIVHQQRWEPFLDGDPGALLVPTLGDRWRAWTKGRAHVMAQGGNIKAGTGMAGHAGGRRGGDRNPVWLAAYIETTGRWTAGTKGGFSLAPGLAGRDTCWKRGKDPPPPHTLPPQFARPSPPFPAPE